MTQASTSGYLTTLHRLLVDYFSLDELRTLCFDLNVDFDTLRGEEKFAKSRELITVTLRQNRLAELAARLQALRPNVGMSQPLSAVYAERVRIEFACGF